MADSGRSRPNIEAELASALQLLTPLLDIVEGQVESVDPPAWCEKRTWQTFLLRLDDEVLAACERGAWSSLCSSPGVPDDLRRLVVDVQQATRLPRLVSAPLALEGAALRGVSQRKREQLSALLAVASPLAAHAARIVDIGSGSGHVSRLAAELFGREALAVERDPARVAASSRRAQERARTVGELELEFSTADVLVDAPALKRDDLVVGLHACGELGDAIVGLCAEARCDLILISCCLQKIRSSVRRGTSRAGRDFVLTRRALGLTNLTAQPEGVEMSLAQALRAREVRYALRQLLRARGIRVAPGEEMRGVNRRRAQCGLGELARAVLARRSLPAASTAEIRRFERSAAVEYAALRRLTLPRHLLARLVELTLVLDRGAALEERGYAVRVGTLFDAGVTPRNLALVATAEARAARVEV